MTEAANAPATPPASDAPTAPSTPAAVPPAQEPAAAVTPPADAPAADKPAEPKPQVPEKYEFKYPEGYQVDEAALGEYSTAFKELGLTNEQAQRLVDMDAKRSSSSTEASVAAHKQQVESWVGELKNDPEFGGAKFEANVGIANKALAAFGSPELTQFFKDTGLGNHPQLVKAFHKIGSQLGEGSIHKTTSDQPAAKSLAEMLYPNQTNISN
jgi:hypothetical protein